MITITTVDAGPHTGSVFARWTDHTEMGRALQQMKGMIDARTADGRAYQIILPEQAQAHPEGGWVTEATIALEHWHDARDGELVAALPKIAAQHQRYSTWHYCDGARNHLFTECGRVYMYGGVMSEVLMLDGVKYDDLH